MITVPPTVEIQPATRMVESSPEQRLDLLARTIREQHEATVGAARAMVLHAIACGEALIEAKSIVPSGDWNRWLEENAPFGKRRSISRSYMRLAALKEHVDMELGVAANIQLLVGLPARYSGVARVSPEVKREALRLHEAGEPVAAIARQVDASEKAVRTWIDPAYADHCRALRRSAFARRPQLSDEAPLEPVATDERSLRYGEPGRPAVGRAVRRLAIAQGRVATREALLDLAAIAHAWAERLTA